MSGPQGRLRDDLYSLYLAALAWVLIPVYGRNLSVILPSSWTDYGPVLDWAIVGGAGLAVWIGLRGGPLLVPRSVVVHELGSPRSVRSVLWARFVRQAVAAGALAAIGTAALLAVSDAAGFSYGVSFHYSLVAGLAAVGITGQAVCWLVAFGGHVRGRVAATALALIAPAVMVGTIAAGFTLSGGAGLVALAVSVVVSLGLAALALDDVAVDGLWRRASALDSMRSSLQTADLQRVVLDMRRATDQPVLHRGPSLARPWMPVALWRYLASSQHLLGWRLARVATAATVAAVLMRYASVDEGIIALAVAGCTLVVGVDLAASIAALSDQAILTIHYRHGSAAILRSQLVVALVFGLVIGALAVAPGASPLGGTVAGGVLVLFAFGTLAAAVMARMGSPDLVGLIDTFGVQYIAVILWLRALLGPVLLFVATVAVSHQFFRPDDLPIQWPWLLAVAAVGAVVLATRPLERTCPPP
ncbi:MAG: hypothetical protein ACK5RL_21315 [Acidimicrobiales bacterium]